MQQSYVYGRKQKKTKSISTIEDRMKIFNLLVDTVIDLIWY